MIGADIRLVLDFAVLGHVPRLRRVEWPLERVVHALALRRVTAQGVHGGVVVSVGLELPAPLVADNRRCNALILRVVPELIRDPVVQGSTTGQRGVVLNGNFERTWLASRKPVRVR